MPKKEPNIIKVIGVGGGGSNAVTNMYRQGIVGVDFAVSNTDSQAMELSPVTTRIQLGPELTEGRGAGSKPDVGMRACEESIEDVRRFIADGTKMIFITAGMGGGTGTGAAPVIAELAREMGILTVGIVTLPFTFEGRRRKQQGLEGLERLKENVDTIIVISNDKLRQIHGNLRLSEAFSQADSILTVAAKGIAEIITVPGYINVDFEDVNTVMRNSGVAIMGTAQAEGEDRAKRAVDAALSSPLLEDNNIKGANHILLNITSGTKEVTMDEIFEITEYVQEEAGHGTDLIWGNCFDESLGDQISVTVIATGFQDKRSRVEETRQRPEPKRRAVVGLDDEPRQEATDEYLNPRNATARYSDEPKPTGDGLYETGHNDGEETQTFEFDDFEAQREKYRRTQPDYEPRRADRSDDTLRNAVPLDSDTPVTPSPRPIRRTPEVHAAATRPVDEQMRELSAKLNNPQTIHELESEPAYIRRRVRLDDVE